VVGGRITEGVFKVGDTVKIIRRENEIQEGKVVGLQQNKLDAKEVKEGNECGILVEAKLDIAGGDVLQAYTKVVK
jgi:translation initiation factor IF-2